MPRLLYVVNIPRFFYTHRLPLALAARDAGYDVHIATSDADREHVALIQQSGLPYYPLPLAQHGLNPLAELNTLRALLRLYRQLQPDIVHHVSIKPVIYGGLAARLARVPAIVSAMSGLGLVFVAQGMKARILRLLVSPALWLALRTPNTQMIFQNPDDRARFVDLGLIAAQRTTLIRGSGVDVTRFTPQSEAPGLPVVLFAGRLLWKKGLGEFVAAARQLKGRARFVVAGYEEGSSPDNVPSAQLEAWASEGLIEWWGKRDDMPHVFAAAHVVCLPSTYGEGVPRVLIEAAACGRAIVTTDTPGCREIVTHEHNGLLVAPHDEAALRAALARLIDDPALRQQLGARGVAIAREHFSFAQVAHETFALYTNLLRAAGRPSLSPAESQKQE